MITIYSTKTCVYCVHVEKYLTSKGIAYHKVMIDDDQKLRQELFEKTGAMTVPITTDGENYVVGWNLANLKKLIEGWLGK